jgi:FXSXX-COOH protein
LRGTAFPIGRARSNDVADDPELASELIDVSGLTPEQVEAMPESVLRNSLRRVLAEDPSTPGQYASFQNRL